MKDKDCFKRKTVSMVFVINNKMVAWNSFKVDKIKIEL